MSNKETDERFTPRKYIESARIVLGTIDLDPATSIIANTRIRAKNIFTFDDDGLNQNWFGNIFCNPPYSRGNLQKWCSKSVLEFSTTSTINEILLVPNDSSANWFKTINIFPICLTDHRIEFLTLENGRFIYNKNPENGSAFVLLSDSINTYKKFCNEFQKYGPIFRRVHYPLI